MNRKQMTELFAILMVAYPGAEMFRGETGRDLKSALGDTVTLWTACLSDVDPWIGRRAVLELVKTCRFAPTPAELRAAAGKAEEEVRQEIRDAYLAARNEAMIWDRETALRRMPARSRQAVEAMGGMDAFSPPGSSSFDMEGFLETYERLLRSTPEQLPGARAPRLVEGRQAPGAGRYPGEAGDGPEWRGQREAAQFSRERPDVEEYARREAPRFAAEAGGEKIGRRETPTGSEVRQGTDGGQRPEGRRSAEG